MMACKIRTLIKIRIFASFTLRYRNNLDQISIISLKIELARFDGWPKQLPYNKNGRNPFIFSKWRQSFFHCIVSFSIAKVRTLNTSLKDFRLNCFILSKSSWINSQFAADFRLLWPSFVYFKISLLITFSHLVIEKLCRILVCFIYVFLLHFQKTDQGSF